uniref:ETFB lysine methyltransferase n=1 Tax=Ananas comosus var. bracteatus TaxID=296719 RepID=A0A6V7PAU5_ANACO|nr:unnamed protein product [Ananas comosus var. bracteatus]
MGRFLCHLYSSLLLRYNVMELLDLLLLVSGGLNLPLDTPIIQESKSRKRRRRKLLHKSSCCDAAADVSAPFYSAHFVAANEMPWEALSEALMCFGANCISMDELSDHGDHDEICLTSIFPDGQDVSACISNAASSVGLDYVPNYEVSMGKQCDWVTNAQESFHPIEVIDGLWIVPSGGIPLYDPRATNILLNPGLAFGTGEHPTTKLCLLLLHEAIKGGEHFFDYGTGSGVLGIAALKMGAAMSVGIDIEPQAVTSARENLSLNGIESSKMSVYLVPSKVNSPNIESAKGKFDIVIANILMNPLMELAEDIVSYGKPEAVVGVSGILCEQQVLQIKEVYSQHLDNIWVSEMEGWACLRGTKKRI